eukprot:COSAG01_NODE_1731_length_9369_cov_35.048220_1_plen_190_part_00
MGGGEATRGGLLAARLRRGMPNGAVVAARTQLPLQLGCLAGVALADAEVSRVVAAEPDRAVAPPSSAVRGRVSMRGLADQRIELLRLRATRGIVRDAGVVLRHVAPGVEARLALGGHWCASGFPPQQQGWRAEQQHRQCHIRRRVLTNSQLTDPVYAMHYLRTPPDRPMDSLWEVKKCSVGSPHLCLLR